MQSEQEVTSKPIDDFRKEIPSIENWLSCRFNGVWNNGYRNGYEQGVEVGKADVQNKLEVIDEIKQGEYNRGYNECLAATMCDDTAIKYLRLSGWLPEHDRINYDLGFKVGMDTAWDLARKLRHPSYSGICDDEREAIFGYRNSDDVLTQFTAAGALEALHEYGLKKTAEEKQKQPEKHDWKVGDCVYDSSGNFCMITQIGTHIHVLYPNGKTHKWSKGTRFRKAADKHLDFPKILEFVADAEQA